MIFEQLWISKPLNLSYVFTNKSANHMQLEALSYLHCIVNNNCYDSEATLTTERIAVVSKAGYHQV